MTANRLKKTAADQSSVPGEGQQERRTDRRGLLGAMAAGIASLAGLFAAARVSAELTGEEGDPGDSEASGTDAKPRSRWGMVIDLDLCTGCGACVVACRAENNVPAAGPELEKDGTRIEWMTLQRKSRGTYPNVRTTAIPMPCNHCEDPPCVSVCPVGATYASEEGVIAQIWEQCIGCRYCMMACPYSRRYFNWYPPEWPESYRALLNPDVATRPAGIVEKCTFCYHRIRAVREKAGLEGREMKDGDIQTACQEVCPARAITFGDLNDPDSEVARLSQSPRAFRLLDELENKPKVYYLGKDWTP